MFKLVVTCVFLGFLGLVFVESCEFKDKMCPMPYTKQMADDIVNQHNIHRREANPTASDMVKMYWDDTMAEMAQKFTEKCKFKHNSYAERSFAGYTAVGQNLFAGSRKPTAISPVTSWYNEVKKFTYGTGGNFMAVGHYTQVMQGKTARIGCGASYCPQAGRLKYIVSCHYLEGQFHWKKPYKSGKPCGACPNSCKNRLCDCGGRVCQYGGIIDINTCKCKCKIGTKGDSCEDNCGGKVCKNGGTLIAADNCKCKCREGTEGEFCEKFKCDMKEKWQCPHYKRRGYCRYYKFDCPISCDLC